MATREDAAAEPAVDPPGRPPLLDGPSPAGAGPPSVAPVVVPRWIQLVLLPLAIVGLVAIVQAAGPVVLIFTIAALIALLLNPFVTILRRARLPRGLAVLVVYTCLGLVLAGVVYVLANPIADQVTTLRDDVPQYVDDANRALADVQAWLDRNEIGVQVSEQGQSALATLGRNLTTGSGDIVNFTRDALTTLVEASIAVILVIVLSVYMLIYGERIGAAVRKVVPQGDGTPEDDYPTRVQKAVFGYVRGQTLFSLIMGASAGVALYVMGSLGIFEDGKTYALFFGAFYGAAELIPYIGPAIGAAPPVLIALFSDTPTHALWLTLMFIALQQLEGHVVAPQVFSQALRINPLLVILALLLGGQLYGLIGAFVALPIAAILRETTVYLRRHLVLERWGTPGAAELVGAGAGVATVRGASPPAAAGRCPECGAARRPGAEVCAACGTELAGGDDAVAAGSSAPG